MVILEPLSVRGMSVSNLRVGLYLYSWNGSYSALSPVLHGDIALSINTNTIQQIQYNLPQGLKFFFCHLPIFGGFAPMTESNGVSVYVKL